MADSEEWQEWLRQPMTKRFVEVMRRTRGEILESWANGAFTNAQEGGTIQLNAEALGKVVQLDSLIRIEADELRDAEEHFGIETGGASNRRAAD